MKLLAQIFYFDAAIWLVVVVQLLLLMTTSTDAEFYSKSIAQDHLLTDLSMKYNPQTKPTVANDGPIEVRVNITIQNFEFRESDGAFCFSGTFEMRWNDPKCVWNPKDYNNLTSIVVNQRAIWVPDLEIYNNAPDKFLRTHRNGVAKLLHTGEFRWFDAIEAVIFCTTNMHNWPHDQHVCNLSLGSWTYDGFLLDIRNIGANATTHIDKRFEVHNPMYRVTSFTTERVETYYNCCPEPYIKIEYSIKLERRAAFVLIFRAMAFAIILLSLLALSLEPWRGNKILLNGFAMALVIFNLLYFSDKVSKFARGTPLIVTFYSYSLLLTTLGQLVSTFALMATRSHIRSKLPHSLYKLLHLPWIGMLTPRKGRHRFEVDSNEEKLFDNSLHSEDWILLAIVVERIALILFSIAFLLLATTCFV